MTSGAAATSPHVVELKLMPFGLHDVPEDLRAAIQEEIASTTSRAALIDMGIGDIEAYRRFTRELAVERGWEYTEMEGDTSLLRRLANGDWDPADFLTVQPGRSVAESFDEGIVREG